MRRHNPTLKTALTKPKIIGAFYLGRYSGRMQGYSMDRFRFFADSDLQENELPVNSETRAIWLAGYWGDAPGILNAYGVDPLDYRMPELTRRGIALTDRGYYPEKSPDLTRENPHSRHNPLPARQIPEDLSRDEAIRRIKAGLQSQTGNPWSVTGGHGTSWGWIHINAPPKRRTWSWRLKPGEFINIPENYEEYDMGHPGGHMSPADRAELGQALGLREPVHYQGESASGRTYSYQEYVDRAEGRTLAFFEEDLLD
jgi:hypothetical protein